MSANSVDILKPLEDDDYLAQFLNTTEGKPIKDINFITSHSFSAAEQLSKLSKGITYLEKEIRNIILEKHEELTSESLWLNKFELRLLTLQHQLERVSVLSKSIKKKVDGPYETMKTHCATLNRLHDTSDILQCIIFLRHVVQNFPRDDFIKASASIREIDDILQDIDLNDLDISKHDQHFIKSERLKLQQAAEQMFITGIETLNKTEITMAICILSNLRSLKQLLDDFVHKSITAIEKSTDSALNTQALSQSSVDKTEGEKFSKNFSPGKITGGTFPGVSVANFRSMLWNNWSNLLESVVYSKCEQMFIVDTILYEHEVFRVVSECLNTDIEKIAVAYRFWDRTSDILSKRLATSTRNSSFIKQALEGEYPKLLRLYIDLDKKLQKLCNLNIAIENYPFPYRNHFAEPFENAYLSRSLSRLVNSVESMFSGSDLPTNEGVDSFVHIITGELSVSSVNASLNSSVARNVEKALRLFYLKCEQLLNLEGDFTQVIDPLNDVQEMNIGIANVIYYLQKQLSGSLENMNTTDISSAVLSRIRELLNNLDDIINGVLSPLCLSICEAIESIILTMHEEDFDRSNSSQSLYMKELKTFVKRTVNDYLKPFHHEKLLQKGYKTIAVRCIELFLRHASLVRPLNESGRRRLTTDFNQMEYIIRQLCENSNELGRIYKTLKSFSKLINMDVKQLEECELIGDVVPYSLLLMYMFSYAPSDMLSPHQSCSWSLARLSQWLDNHTLEIERLEIINGALNRYQQDKRQNEKLDDIYLIMTKILQKGFKL